MNQQFWVWNIEIYFEDAHKKIHLLWFLDWQKNKKDHFKNQFLLYVKKICVIVIRLVISVVQKNSYNVSKIEKWLFSKTFFLVFHLDVSH